MQESCKLQLQTISDGNKLRLQAIAASYRVEVQLHRKQLARLLLYFNKSYTLASPRPLVGIGAILQWSSLEATGDSP